MGKKVYEVEDILDFKYQRKKRFFLIKWKGYSVEESTWEPEAHLNCPAIISRFNAKIDLQEDEADELLPHAHKKRSNLIIPSPSSTRSTSPHRRLSMSPSRMISKPQGISQFFKPSAAIFNDVNYDESGSQSEPGQQINSGTTGQYETNKLFNDSMKKFQKMLSRVPGPPLCIKNDFDKTLPPSHFIYINETIYGQDVTKPDASFLVGCSCYVIDEIGGRSSSRGGGCCLHEECECISQNPDGHPAYDSDGLLLPDTSVIYECNKKCCCSIFNQPCKNKVIQLGRQVSLTIVRLPDVRGWGVIANHDIPRGTFIDLYLGEVISSKEATRRLISNNKNGSNTNSEIGSYLFDLDFNYDFGTECEFTLDAYRYGNVSHFFNHSCSPNLKVFPCFIEHLDPRLHSIAFFACQSIAKGEQLTFDYKGLQGSLSQNNNCQIPQKRKSSNEILKTEEKAEEKDIEKDLLSKPQLDFKDLIPDSRRSSTGLGSKRNQKNEPIKCLCASTNCRKFIYL